MDRLKTRGVASNRMALGARVEIEIVEGGKTRKIYEMVSPGSSFGGNSLQMEIGLGKAESIRSAKIYWPDKKRTVQEVTALSLDKAYHIKEGSEPVLVEYTMTPFKKEAGHYH